MAVPKIFYKYIFWFGLLMVSIGIIITIFNIKFYLNSISTKGKIINLVEVSSSDLGHNTYAPEFEYFVNNKKYSKQSKASSNPPAFDIGQEIEVRFIESNPNGAKIDSFFNLFGGGTIALIIGIGCLIIRFIMKTIQNAK